MLGFRRGSFGVALHEVLILACFAAVLAVIITPQIHEGQTRTLVARAKQDLHRLDCATQAYIYENQVKPKTYSLSTVVRIFNWWGFVSQDLTTPVAYINPMPVAAFMDSAILGQWVSSFKGDASQMPYTYIRNTWLAASWKPGTVAATHPSFGTLTVPYEFHHAASQSSYILYSCGPDRLDSSVYGAPEFYDPSNGTLSFGDIYCFGPGHPPKDFVTGNSM